MTPRHAKKSAPVQRKPVRPTTRTTTVSPAAARQASPARRATTNARSAAQRTKSVRGLSTSRLPIALTFACSAIVAFVIAFGNPVLWVTAEQQIASNYAAGTDEDDYQFIEQVVGGEGDTANLVCLGEYKAISQDDDSDRASNIDLAARTLDGTEIKPGETFSVNEALGDTSQDERYFETAVVDGTTLVKGRGGGVCQVSTALYIAALKANLEIVERYPHTIVSDYAPIGLDATLAYGQKDLRIKNNTEKSVFIRATALGQTVDVKLYGTAGVDGESIDATSKIIDRFDLPAADVYDDPGLLGLNPDDPVTFYVAESYRVLYRDGTMVSNDLLSTDTYQVSVQSGVLVGEGGVDPAK